MFNMFWMQYQYGLFIVDYDNLVRDHVEVAHVRLLRASAAVRYVTFEYVPVEQIVRKWCRSPLTGCTLVELCWRLPVSCEEGGRVQRHYQGSGPCAGQGSQLPLREPGGQPHPRSWLPCWSTSVRRCWSWRLCTHCGYVVECRDPARPPSG